MKLKITIKGVVYEVDVEVLDEGVFTDNLSKPLVKSSSQSNFSYVPNVKRSAGVQSGKGLYAPVMGVIIQIACKEGDEVSKGDTLVVLEAMKMRNSLVADRDGTIKKINVAVGDSVKEGSLLVEY